MGEGEWVTAGQEGAFTAALAAAASVPPPCTGITASWCPACGDCVCPTTDDGEPLVAYEGGNRRLAGTTIVYWDEYAVGYQLIHPFCPLHSPDSTHGESGE